MIANKLDPIDKQWATAVIVIPDGPSFRMAVNRQGILRIRKYDTGRPWKAIEVDLTSDDTDKILIEFD